MKAEIRIDKRWSLCRCSDFELLSTFADSAFGFGAFHGSRDVTRAWPFGVPQPVQRS
jgi:hypothetical protein